MQDADQNYVRIKRGKESLLSVAQQDTFFHDANVLKNLGSFSCHLIWRLSFIESPQEG